MVKRSFRFSGENQNVEDLAQMFQLNVKSIRDFSFQIYNGQIIEEQFIGMNHYEVQEKFDALLLEIEFSFCLNMIAATEAKLRMDYLVRATNRLKDELSRDFRSIYKERETNISLEESILETWKKRYPDYKGYVSDFYWSA